MLETENLNHDLSEDEIKELVKSIKKSKPPLEDLCKEVTEREFMLMLEFDNSWTVEEKLAFYHKHCKN